jgi:hypothetical protein
MRKVTKSAMYKQAKDEPPIHDIFLIALLDTSSASARAVHADKILQQTAKLACRNV